MSEIGQHTGTTIIHSKMLANDPEFWNTEKAKELFEKIIPDSNEEWKKNYQIIKTHSPLDPEISKEEAMAFCCRGDTRTYDNWDKRPPVDRVVLLNIFLLYGYRFSEIKQVDYIFSRIVHLTEPSKCTSILDTCFLFCCKHLDYQNYFLPIIRKREGSPLSMLLDLALEYLESDYKPKMYTRSLIAKGRYSPSQENLLCSFFKEIKEAYSKIQYEIRNNVEERFDDKKREINDKRKAQGKTPLFSNNYLQKYKNLPGGFSSVISRYCNPKLQFLRKANEYKQRDLIGRDYIIKLCLHYSMGIDEINEILTLLKFDPLSYKNVLDIVLIYTISVLSNNDKYDVDMEYGDIERIITRSNALLSIFGDNYIIVQEEALKYFEGFKERR